MKIFVAKYMLYIYLKFIKEDWYDYKKWIIPFLKPAWFVRCIYIWCVSVIFLPVFYLGMIIEENQKK